MERQCLSVKDAEGYGDIEHSLIGWPYLGMCAVNSQVVHANFSDVLNMISSADDCVPVTKKMTISPPNRGVLMATSRPRSQLWLRCAG